MVEITRLATNPGNISTTSNRSYSPHIGYRELVEDYDLEEDVYEIVDNPNFARQERTSPNNRLAINFSIARNVQEALDKISYSLHSFLERLAIMDRNVFSLNNRG